MKVICICGPYPEPVGGVSIHIMRLSEALNKNFDFLFIDESPLRKPGIYNLRSLNFIKYLFIIFSADLIHVNSSVPLFRFLHIFFGRLLRKKILITLHSYRLPGFFDRLLNWFSFYFASNIIAVSSEVSNSLKFDNVIIPAFVSPSEKEFVISDFFQSLIYKIKLSSKILVVSNAYSLPLLSGRDLYGFSDLIELFKDEEVRERFSIILNVSTTKDCTGLYNQYIKDIIDCGLEDAVFLFNKPLSFVGLLNSADVYIRSTLSDGDALSVREALLLGVNTIASDCVARPVGTNTFKTGDLGSLKEVLLSSTRQNNVACLSFENDILEIYKNLICNK